MGARIVMGQLIVIDGLDGSGKTTQVCLLVDYLNKIGYEAQRVKFPAYNYESSTLIKMYLDGKINKDASKVNPYAASILYSADRYIQFQTKLSYFKESSDKTVIVCDRYISANIIHQGGKFSNIKEREEYYSWCYDFETGKLGLPREDKTILLLLKPEISQKLLSKRYNNNEEMKDIHEGNIDYLTKCYNSAVHAAGYNGWDTIECGNNQNEIREVEDIHKDIINKVSSILKGGV